MAKKHNEELDLYDLDHGHELITDHSYRIVDNEHLKDYMSNNALYIKLFYTFHDKRILLTHHTWWKKTNNDLEAYCKKYITDLTKRLRIEEMALTPAELEQKWYLQEYDIPGYEDVLLKAVVIRSWVKNDNNKKWLVVVHGLNSHKFRAIFFGLIYLRLGYNVLVFDQRNHGESTSKITTMGYYEKYDLAVVVNFLQTTIDPKLKELNFHGWSMGTFVIMEYLKLAFAKNKLINSVILDSTISNLNALYRYYMLKIKVNYYEHYYAIRRYTIDTRGYDPEQINPGENLDQLAKLPVLYLLNRKDHATPYVMGREAYQNKRRYERKKISNRVVFNCDHVRGIYYNPPQYLEAITAFITNAKRK
ncbi:alpha/beta hydrolase [Spiroplasma endosymbiont of Phyllotreta cruciferae]|uniref:alpha/beta hydrolase n=1 Tax=Spiroplasma endosymbiont of Phyllotreta cruciferae TaxID=2886375 RepID=UPI00209DFC21|nr:alpha/beta fold hydrolase [Spiroplasma endosymbiont of Phyllotreta cruciferae]